MVSLPLFVQGSAGVDCLGIILRLVPAYIESKVILLDNYKHEEYYMTFIQYISGLMSQSEDALFNSGCWINIGFVNLTLGLPVS